MLVKKRLLVAAVMLSLATLACAFNTGGPKYPQSSIPVSVEASQSLQQAVTDAVAQGMLSGEFTLTVTEAQLTSYLALNLNQENLAEPAEPVEPGDAAEQVNPLEQGASIVSNPQVYLQDGKMQMYGTLQSGLVSATGRMVLSVIPDVDGNMVVELTEMDFGPLPLPEGFKSIFSTTLSDVINGAFGPITAGFRIENITIADGTMTLTGRTR
jgi:hypothetical protein